MRRKRKDEEKEQPTEKNYVVKYPKPKILLVDLPPSCLDSVRSAGFNALAGTFGSPYKVPLVNEYMPVVVEAHLPNCTEQEIVFIDLTPPDTIDGPTGGEIMTSVSKYDWWVKCSSGMIDPRPIVMYAVQSHFDRILEHGGLFVIFAQPRLEQELVESRVNPEYTRTGSELCHDNWSFLSILSSYRFITIEQDYGEEISLPDYFNKIPDGIDEIVRFLQVNIQDAEYTAIFKSDYIPEENRWIPLLNSKFRDCVGGVIFSKDSKGCILILPQISRKDQAIVALLSEVLPAISPHLFPHIEGAKWVERDEYELDSVLSHKKEKMEVEQRARRELEELDKKISEERDKFGFLHGMITRTGDDLVSDVKLCLEFIGFEKVIDIDEQIRNATEQEGQQKQEDLQIHDRSPILLLEIKGLSGKPTEDDVNQVIKYVTRRMREWDTIDVRGVSIINHQRNLPTLDRDNRNVFTKSQMKDAEDQKTTLLTTWDLFLLVRGMLKWNWNPEVIRDLFYKAGRMPKMPKNYRSIGEIVKYWPELEVISIQISKEAQDKISIGDRLGYITSAAYLEEEISSLQVDRQDVEEALPGQTVGVKTKYPKEKLRKGTIVCKVIK